MSEDKKARLEPLVQLVVLAVLIGILYHAILAGLILQWWNDPDYSHGFFVPLFSAFVIWQKRESLASQRLKPSWFGLLIVVGAMIIMIVGILGAELFLSRSSFVVLLAGLTILFGGWQFFGTVWFPWAILFLAIPIPTIVYNQITLPLQFFASALAGSLLTLTGVPVLREGNIIHLSMLDLEVAEACSGIRSLISLGTLAIFYGYFLERRVWRRVALVLAAVPIAVAANGLRIMGTGILGEYWDPRKAEGFFHTFSGWVIFVLSIGMLFLLHRILDIVSQWSRAEGRISV